MCLRNVGVFIGKKVWLENGLNQKKGKFSYHRLNGLLCQTKMISSISLLNIKRNVRSSERQQAFQRNFPRSGKTKFFSPTVRGGRSSFVKARDYTQ